MRHHFDTMKTPNPGSKEAIEMGCKCPVLDNAHGKGYRGIPNVFVYSSLCELHHPRVDPDQTEADYAEEEPLDSFGD